MGELRLFEIILRLTSMEAGKCLSNIGSLHSD